ncbi:MAG: hypothetical protein WCS17_13660, partial [Prevotella sp.]
MNKITAFRTAKSTGLLEQDTSPALRPKASVRPTMVRRLEKSCPSCKSCPRNYGNVTPWRIPMECRPASHPFSTKRLSLRDILMTAVR